MQNNINNLVCKNCHDQIHRSFIVVVIKVYFFIINNNIKKNKFDKLKIIIKTKDIALAHLGQMENEIKELNHHSSSPGLGGTKTTNHWFLFFVFFFSKENQSLIN